MVMRYAFPAALSLIVVKFVQAAREVIGGMTAFENRPGQVECPELGGKLPYRVIPAKAGT
jgi:hypothetical protein